MVKLNQINVSSAYSKSSNEKIRKSKQEDHDNNMNDDQSVIMKRSDLNQDVI